MSKTLLALVRDLNTLNDDNLADRVIANNDVQNCLLELQDILEANYVQDTGKDNNVPTKAPLTCEGCYWQRYGSFGNCIDCIRRKDKDNYCRIPERQEDTK